MYYENVNRTFNTWRDGNLLHVFISVKDEQSYKQYSKTINYVKGILGLNFKYEYDGKEIYFPLSDFRELNEFKEYFYRYLCIFKEKKENEN